MTVRDGKNDQKIQNEVVKEMLDAGCEILAVDLVDRTEPSNIIKMAKKENIPVIFFNRDFIDNPFNCYTSVTYLKNFTI